MKVDVLVIGAGPAGLMAARTAAASGASVVVVDESRCAGGRLAARVDTLSEAGLDGQRADKAAQELVAAAEKAGAVIHLETLCWALFEDCSAILRQGKVEAVQSRATVVATGSLAAPYPVTGWTLPGVMTAAAVERSINQMFFRPGSAAVVVGEGPEAERVAWLLELTGAGVVRAAHVEAITGQARVENVTFDGASRPADLVVLAAGRVPQVELLNAAGCPLDGYGVPAHDERLATPLPGVLVAGAAAGAASLAESLVTGELAGVSAAEMAGALTQAAAAARRAELQRQREKGAPLSAPLPPAPLPVNEFALVCRCEEVPRTEIGDAIAAGARTVDDIKRMTRCGMGFCQGKSCTLTVVRLLDAAGVRPEPSPLRLRPPVHPIRLSALAAGGKDVSILERAIHQEGSEPTS